MGASSWAYRPLAHHSRRRETQRDIAAGAQYEATLDATSAHRCRFSGKRTPRSTTSRWPGGVQLHSDGAETCRRNFAEPLRALSIHIRTHQQNRTSTHARKSGGTSPRYRPQHRIERVASHITPVTSPQRPRVSLALFCPSLNASGDKARYSRVRAVRGNACSPYTQQALPVQVASLHLCHYLIIRSFELQ